MFTDVSPVAPSPYTAAYKEYGDFRPPLDFLEEAWESMSKSARPGVLLTAADVSIDLAFMNPDEAEHYISRSEELLATIVETTKSYAQYSGVDVSRDSVTASAILHAADLPNLLLAAQWEPTEPKPDYLKILEAMDEALAYANGPQGEELLFEATPNLLGARGLSRGTCGWAGRLALSRENFRPLNRIGMNSNWDAGICPPGGRRTLEKPYRLQIKRRPQRESGRMTKNYNRAGVAVVYAEQAGFDDPVQIVESCWNEIKPLKDVASANGLLSTEQLDTIAKNIYAQATTITRGR